MDMLYDRNPTVYIFLFDFELDIVCYFSKNRLYSVLKIIRHFNVQLLNQLIIFVGMCGFDSIVTELPERLAMRSR